MNRLDARQAAAAVVNKGAVQVKPITSIGTVATLAVDNVPITATENVTVGLTSASGAAKTFLMFDPTGILAKSDTGTTFSDPDSIESNDLSVAVVKASFYSNSWLVSGVQYEVTSSATQFNKTMKYIVGNVDGSFKPTPLNVTSLQRNNQQNTKILTIQFREPLKMSWNRGFSLNVGDGEDVYLTFFIDASSNVN